jgi:hypothetical protein
MPTSVRRARIQRFFRSKSMGWFRSRMLPRLMDWERVAIAKSSEGRRNAGNQIHSPKRIVYVRALGWGKCWECGRVQEFYREGEHRCEGCNWWLDIQVNPDKARQEFPVHIMKLSYEEVACGCGNKVSVFGSGLKRCSSCQGFIDVRILR